MNEVRIETYDHSFFERVVDLLADAFLTNPINVALFGGSGAEQRRLNRAMFEVTLRHALPGEKVVARSSAGVVGFMQYVAYPGCRPSREEISAVMPPMSAAIGAALPRVGQWLRAWRDRDPEEPHLHLGTLAVRPDMQGKQIGSLLMKTYEARLEGERRLGYLETDRPENVRFYERLGFNVTEELEVIDVKTWLMRKPAA